ncbi:MAG: hypothetical protein ACLUEU_10860 [Oscillospiraceae bacterium]
MFRKSVRGIGAGETTLLITASYRINATRDGAVSRIVPVTVPAWQPTARRKKERRGIGMKKLKNEQGRDHSDGPPAGH